METARLFEEKAAELQTSLLAWAQEKRVLRDGDRLVVTITLESSTPVVEVRVVNTRETGDYANIPIDNLDHIWGRPLNVLARNGIKTVQDLLRLKNRPDALFAHFGRTSFRALRRGLNDKEIPLPTHWSVFH